MPNAPSSALVVIPARMASTRLPGKPLAEIAGEPMIVHVWRRAMEAGIGPVVVACAEAGIADVILRTGGDAVVTTGDHQSGSDRIFEAVTMADPQARHSVVVNVQGDLPTIAPDAIRACLAPLEESAVDIATLAAEITEDDERADPNVVKLVGTPAGAGILRALYFTRATAPFGDGPLFHHIGLYAYRRSALDRFVSLPPSPLEIREKLEQLRALEDGMRIDAALVKDVPLGVDTPGDLERARAMLGAGSP